jgi:hypothetical protein
MQDVFMHPGRSHDANTLSVGHCSSESIRAVEVLDAYAAALSWLSARTGTFPVPVLALSRLQDAAELLLAGVDRRDPRDALVEVAAAVAEDI